VTIDGIIAIVEKAREDFRSYTGYYEILRALKQYQADAEYQSWIKAS
jgi:hypothetical protein